VKVTINWSEVCEYRSTVEVDEDDYRRWCTEENDPALDPDDPNVLESYLTEEADGPRWFEKVDVHADFLGASDRSVDSIET
jgi:hypothetical protein